MSQNKIKPGSISSGTLQTKDLWHAFFNELVRINPDKGWQGIFLDAAMEPNYFESEDALWDLDTFEQTLQSLAPEGYYFGQHWNDGKNFGFWLLEDY